MTETTNDSAVLADLMDRFRGRENVGLRKYGTTLDRKDLSPADLRQHLLEELMDGCMYLVAEQHAEALASTVMDGGAVDSNVAYLACKVGRLTRDEPSRGEVTLMQRRLEWFLERGGRPTPWTVQLACRDLDSEVGDVEAPGIHSPFNACMYRDECRTRYAAADDQAGGVVYEARRNDIYGQWAEITGALYNALVGDSNWVVRKLYGTPQSPMGTLPDGWKLVPKKATPEMLRRARNAPVPAVMVNSLAARADLDNGARWDAMLAAAPEVRS